MTRRLDIVSKHAIGVEVSRLDRTKRPGFATFSRGFAEGFGSVGYVFRTAQTVRSNKSLAVQLAQAPEERKNSIVIAAKRKIVAKYVGNEMATKLCSASYGTRDGGARRLDALMLHRDFAAAVAKVHG
jgi:hypothetical protein